MFFSTGNLVFARMNLKPAKPAVLMNFVFDWTLCFRLCEVYRFQNLVGLELPLKHALRNVESAALFKKQVRNYFFGPIRHRRPHET